MRFWLWGICLRTTHRMKGRQAETPRTRWKAFFCEVLLSLSFCAIVIQIAQNLVMGGDVRTVLLRSRVSKDASRALHACRSASVVCRVIYSAALPAAHAAAAGKSMFQLRLQLQCAKRRHACRVTETRASTQMIRDF